MESNDEKKARTAGEAGWHASRYNVMASIPDTNMVAIYNTYKRILPKPNDRADVPDDNSENQENLGGIFDTTQKGGEA